MAHVIPRVPTQVPNTHTMMVYIIIMAPLDHLQNDAIAPKVGRKCKKPWKPHYFDQHYCSHLTTIIRVVRSNSRVTREFHDGHTASLHRTSA